MAGTRTAPTIDGTTDLVRVSIKFIDRRGDRRSNAFLVDAATATPAAIETYVAAVQAASRASVYEVEVADIYRGARLASNAEDEVFASADDVLLIAYQPSTGTVTRYNEVRAPIGDIILAGEVVDVENALYVAWRNAGDTIMGTAWSPVSTRFTERVNRNSSVPAT